MHKAPYPVRLGVVHWGLTDACLDLPQGEGPNIVLASVDGLLSASTCLKIAPSHMRSWPFLLSGCGPSERPGMLALFGLEALCLACEPWRWHVA
jgi:hypothetical protein